MKNCICNSIQEMVICRSVHMNTFFILLKEGEKRSNLARHCFGSFVFNIYVSHGYKERHWKLFAYECVSIEAVSVMSEYPQDSG